MPLLTNKRDCLRRAKELLARGEPENLAYAALELRTCLETMTYEKLRSFEKQLPPSFLRRTWQPPQLLKAMTQFDAGADQSVQIYAGIEKVPGTPADPADMRYIGEHKAFGLAWLRKNYNKLGAMLHARRDGPDVDEQALHVGLSEMCDEVEAAQAGSILGAWFGEVITFKCQLCSELVMASTYYIAAERRAICTNERCEAEYEAQLVESGGLFVLRAIEMKCVHCDAQILVQKRHLVESQPIICPGCEGRQELHATWRFE